MLNQPAPFPFVGSHGLLVDQGATHLVRILFRRWHGGDDGYPVAVVSFPLREGATGNKEVPEAELIDGTPLDRADRRQLADLDRDLRDRRISSPRLKHLAATRDRLKQRAMFAPMLEQRLRDLNTPWHKRSLDRRRAA